MPVRMEDDYVLTISDNDEFSQNETDSEAENTVDIVAVTTDSSSTDPQNKRKRGGDAADVEVSKVKKQKKKQQSKKKSEDDRDFMSDFEFEAGVDDGLVEDDFDSWGFTPQTKATGNQSQGVDVDEIIARRREAIDSDGEDEVSKPEEDDDDLEAQESDNEEEFTGFNEEDDEYLADDGFGMGAPVDSDDDDDDKDDEETKEGSDSGDESDSGIADQMPDSDGDSDDDERVENPEEVARRAAFFAPEPTTSTDPTDAKKGQGKSFMSMNLSRAVMRGLDRLKFYDATPIQQKAIPIALMGKDIVGGAVTGSGKTAAFLVPILERLMYRSRQAPVTRVAILMPTRELAVQCHSVATQLASFTDITFALLVGGFSLREQEATLKRRPDVVIATPGRFIDHMRNSAGFEVDMIEILVLDEADRMLEDGFADELDEILKTIPKSRQSMLFSATMTDSVDKLIRAGLNRPVRLQVDQTKSAVAGLVQEFVRLRPGKESLRLPYLMYLCEKVYRQRVIVFFRQKQEVHRIRVLFGLCGLKATELHGSMSQEQRMKAVEDFRSGNANFLLATDVASRGLDIKAVDAVINYEAPQTYEIYIHRIGRTARAGRTGRSCTLAVEGDRKIVREAKKGADSGGSKAVSRNIPTEDSNRWISKVAKLDADIQAVLSEEKAERFITQAERDLKKGENLVEHRDEILGRPKRTWFESEGQKQEAKEAGFRELNGANPVPKTVQVSGITDRLSNKMKKKMDASRERKENTVSRGKSQAVRAVGGSRGAGGGGGGASGGGAKAKKRSGGSKSGGAGKGKRTGGGKK